MFHTGRPMRPRCEGNRSFSLDPAKFLLHFPATNRDTSFASVLQSRKNEVNSHDSCRWNQRFLHRVEFSGGIPTWQEPCETLSSVRCTELRAQRPGIALKSHLPLSSPFFHFDRPGSGEAEDGGQGHARTDGGAWRFASCLICKRRVSHADGQHPRLVTPLLYFPFPSPPLW